MQMNKFNSSTSLRSDQEENDNPENAFSKLMALPDTTDYVRECKMLLESMKEEMLFEKNVFQRTNYLEIPKSTVLERAKREHYHNYQRLLTYSKKKKHQEDFQRKSCGFMKVQVKKNRALTLKQFVDQKKLKMVTEESKDHFNDIITESILTDDKVRQKLFDESILIERLNFIKRQQMTRQAEPCPIPKKFKGLDPKHMRIPEKITDEQSFYRRKYVHRQKTFQYFRKAINTQNNLLKNKERDNSLVLLNLMNHFKEQALGSNRDELSEQISQCIRRLFLAYANSGSEDITSMYTQISKEKMYQLLEDFHFQYKNNKKIIGIIEQKPITEFYFLEIIHLLSLKEDKEFFTDPNSLFFEKILTRPEIYLPREWQLYEQHKNWILRHLKVRKFKDKLENIYEAVVGQRDSFSFDEMLEAMWLIQIYPFMISKKKLRFFYLYSQSKEAGISLEQLADIYVCIGLSRQGLPEENVRQVVSMVLNFSKDHNSTP